jgi:hypothetical protein
MSTPISKRLLRTAACIAVAVALSIAAPANAERWQKLEPSPGGQMSIDLDSLHWEGRIVRYRVEVKRLVYDVTERFVSTSLINCDRRERKWLETEKFLPDGSSRKQVIDEDWKPIGTSGVEKSRHFLCDRAQ